jgi:hypothetical protein
MQEISDSFLTAVAGHIEKLLLEDQESIAFAFKSQPDGMRLNLGINLDYSKEGIVVNYGLSFRLTPPAAPPKKHMVRLKRIINENQTQMDLG